MKKVYFLCTGNSCRSQIAEGYGHKYLEAVGFEVRSAGIETHGLNPKAVDTMCDDGIDITGQTSDLIDIDYFNNADILITLCGDAKDNCPVIPATATHIHWGLEDPAKFVGTDEEVKQAFANTRDDIKARVKALANEYK